MGEIKSIDLIDFKFTLREWIIGQPLPMELKRMLTQEVLAEISNMAQQEVYAQLEERENKEEEANDCDNIGINNQAEEEKG